MLGEVDSSLKIAVIGTGLIGGSILLRLHEAGMDVTGWDPDVDTRSYARARGVSLTDRMEVALEGRDLIFLGGPLSALSDSLAEVSKYAADSCTITDVGSVKAGIARFASDMRLSHQFLPGHPMAGTEHSGLAAADQSLFDGAAWVLCPYPDQPLDRFRMVALTLATAFGARIVPMPPDMHDSVVALSSHLPHILASALAGTAGRSPLKRGVLGLAAGSFRDGTRVAGTPSRRVADMLSHNREAVTHAVRRVRQAFDELVEALERADTPSLVDQLRVGWSLRQELFLRPMLSATDTFPLGGDRSEFEFLMRVGSTGGYVTDCAVTPSTVTYTTLAPRAEPS
jgi:prephenate dehydrogenase